MQSPRETLDIFNFLNTVIVQYSESKEAELQWYLYHFAFLPKIKGVVFYFLEHLSHDFRTVGWTTQMWS